MSSTTRSTTKVIKKRYNHLLCKWYCPYPPFIAKTIAEKVKKRKAVLTISLFDALWLYGSRLCKFHLKKYCQIAYINFFFLGLQINICSMYLHNNRYPKLSTESKGRKTSVIGLLSFFYKIADFFRLSLYNHQPFTI